MTDNLIARLVLLEIALQSDSGPASREIIRLGVDARQKLVLTDEELETGLEQLTRAGLIETTDGLSRVTSQVSKLLPRTRLGAVSTRRDAWRRLYDRLLPDSRP